MLERSSPAVLGISLTMLADLPQPKACRAMMNDDALFKLILEKWITERLRAWLVSDTSFNRRFMAWFTEVSG
jgi:hypothetical protein